MSDTDTYHCWGCMTSWTGDDLINGECPSCVEEKNE